MKLSESDKKGLNELKIGKLVQNIMTITLNEKLISELELTKLQDKEYSKFTFDVIFPILKKVNMKISIKENTLINGYQRYYIKPIEYNGVQYILTNEWKEFNRSDFMKWIERKLKDL